MPERDTAMPVEAGGAHGGPGNRTPVVDVRNVVEKLLERLEHEGVGNVYAWFAGRPHIIAQVKNGRYVVLMWREGVAIEIELNENMEVEMIRLIVYYGGN